MQSPSNSLLEMLSLNDFEPAVFEPTFIENVRPEKLLDYTVLQFIEG